MDLTHRVVIDTDTHILTSSYSTPKEHLDKHSWANIDNYSGDSDTWMIGWWDINGSNLPHIALTQTWSHKVAWMLNARYTTRLVTNEQHKRKVEKTGRSRHLEEHYALHQELWTWLVICRPTLSQKKGFAPIQFVQSYLKWVFRMNCWIFLAAWCCRLWEYVLLQRGYMHIQNATKWRLWKEFTLTRLMGWILDCLLVCRDVLCRCDNSFECKWQLLEISWTACAHNRSDTYFGSQWQP